MEVARCTRCSLFRDADLGLRELVLRVDRQFVEAERDRLQRVVVGAALDLHEPVVVDHAVDVERRVQDSVDIPGLEVAGRIVPLEHRGSETVGGQDLAVDAAHEHVRHIVVDLHEPVLIEQVDEVAAIVDGGEDLVVRHLLEAQPVEDGEVVGHEVLHHRHVSHVLEVDDLSGAEVDGQHEARPVVADGVEARSALTTDQLHRFGVHVDADVQVGTIHHRRATGRELLQRQLGGIVDELVALNQVAGLRRHDEDPLLIVGDAEFDDVDHVEHPIRLRSLELGEGEPALVDVERDPTQSAGLRNDLRQSVTDHLEVTRIDIHRERGDERRSKHIVCLHEAARPRV